MTTTLKTSCSENIMVLLLIKARVSAWMYFLVLEKGKNARLKCIWEKFLLFRCRHAVIKML